MQKTYSNFEQGSIVVADIFFSDQTTLKRRPLLVISNSKRNETSEDVLVVKITSSEKKMEFDIPLTSAELEKGSLKKESFIRVDFTATLHKSLLTVPIGKITQQKLLSTSFSLWLLPFFGF